MATNIQRFGSMVSDRMKKTAAAAVPVPVELGTINKNLSLTADSLPKTPIPRGDYLVNLMLTGTFTTSSETHAHSGGSHTHEGDDHEHSGGSHTHSGGAHSHRLPAPFRALKAGDRVLIVWCGHNPVVVAIVVES